jgi:outer membrane protein OmpA-like peptidoglycan-associated protein
LRQAGETLAQANAAANDRESDHNIDKLAYLARQKIALTQEVASQKSAEADVANAGKERDQIRLNQRTLEADQANAKAEQAKRAALGAQMDAATAKRQTEIARGDAAQAQRDAQDAQRSAQEARDRTSKLESQLAELSAQKTERGTVIVFGDVLFGIDLARLNTDGLTTAQKLATVLIQNPLRTVLVEGFADSTGSAAHNQTLSERRATAVQSALKNYGVPTERIAIRGYGESYPVAPNDTGMNRQLNRRVEIILSDENGKVNPR